MFRYEIDMLPFIQEFFSIKFEKGYFVKEFKAGIGVADLVFAPTINKREYYFDDFEMLYHTLALFNKKNKKVNEYDLLSRFSKKKISSLIEKFIHLGLIEEIDNNSYLVRNKLSPTISNFYAIEAKLSDWKGGFYQALRYKNFAQKSFLAISSDFIHRVDKDLLISNNVGLISVSVNKTSIVIYPKKKKPNDEVAFYYSGENFTKKIYLEKEKEYCSQQWL